MRTESQQTLRVNKLTDLYKLLTDKELYNAINFLDTSMLKEDTEKVERRLLNYHNSCGCGSGNLFGVFTMVLVLPMLIWAFSNGYLEQWQAVTIGFLTFIGSVGLGKAFGFWRAQSALKIEIESLISKQSKKIE